MSKPSLSPEQLERLAADGVNLDDALGGLTREQIAERILAIDPALLPEGYPDPDMLASLITGDLKLPRGRPSLTDEQRRQPKFEDIVRNDNDELKRAGKSRSERIAILMEKHRREHSTIEHAINRKSTKNQRD